VDENGNPRGIDNVIHTEMVNGWPVYYLKTPKLLEVARNHFGCPTLDRVKLWGLQGFDRNLLHNEIGVEGFLFDPLTRNGVFSDFALAALQDSGWY
jgi:hypothetical protein